MERPVVFDFLDYRAFLSESYHYRKQRDKYFSYRYFSKKAGFASPNFLQLVTSGRRNLTNDSIAKVAKGFGLKKNEREYFETLVYMNQAATLEERDHYYRKLIQLKGASEVRKLEKARYDYFSTWYHPVVREVVLFGERNQAAEEIAERMHPKISVKEAEKSLALLEELELIRKDRNGRWEQVEQNVSTGPEVRSLVVANYHRELLRLAAESIERDSPENRDISAVTLSVNRERISELKQRIASFRRELLETASTEERPDQVIQVNIQLFPLTQSE